VLNSPSHQSILSPQHSMVVDLVCHSSHVLTGKLLAAGSHDGNVCLYDVERCQVVGNWRVSPPSLPLPTGGIAAPGGTARGPAPPLCHLSWMEAVPLPPKSTYQEVCSQAGIESWQSIHKAGAALLSKMTTVQQGIGSRGWSLAGTSMLGFPECQPPPSVTCTDVPLPAHALLQPPPLPP
jgi:hypothetical protein